MTASSPLECLSLVSRSFNHQAGSSLPPRHPDHRHGQQGQQRAHRCGSGRVRRRRGGASDSPVPGAARAARRRQALLRLAVRAVERERVGHGLGHGLGPLKGRAGRAALHGVAWRHTRRAQITGRSKSPSGERQRRQAGRAPLGPWQGNRAGSTRSSKGDQQTPPPASGRASGHFTNCSATQRRPCLASIHTCTWPRALSQSGRHCLHAGHSRWRNAQRAFCRAPIGLPALR